MSTRVNLSDEDLLDALRWRESGHSFGQIACALNDRLGVRVTRNAVQGRLSRINEETDKSEALPETAV